MSNLSFTEAVAAIGRGQQVEARERGGLNWYPKNGSSHWFPEEEVYRLKSTPRLLWVNRFKETRVLLGYDTQEEAYNGRTVSGDRISTRWMSTTLYIEYTPEVEKALRKAEIV